MFFLADTLTMNNSFNKKDRMCSERKTGSCDRQKKNEAKQHGGVSSPLDFVLIDHFLSASLDIAEPCASLAVKVVTHTWWSAKDGHKASEICLNNCNLRKLVMRLSNTDI